DLIITGEGKIDAQSMQGKVVGEIARIGREEKIPVIAFCGLLDTTPAVLKKLKFTYVESLADKNISEEEAMINGSKLLTKKVKDYFTYKLTT
ncbi:MAG TPA: glycerate kinase, partial [Chitinophagaceae bacterium]|nr:glycerate kinase [Chitinophagaceae bacterium]